MKKQYDEIANGYIKSKKRFFYDIVDASQAKYFKKFEGLDVLDLACGDGYVTRQIKEIYKAKKVIGVDISSEMIENARKKEEDSPLGLDYYTSCATTFKGKGKFDFVTAMFLLHYAKEKIQLYKMCKAIANNLKKGGMLISANNKGLEKNLLNDYSKYDFKYIVPKELKEGNELMIEVQLSDEVFNIKHNHFCRETYNDALTKAGFIDISWINFDIPVSTDHLNWVDFGEVHAECMLIATKA